MLPRGSRPSRRRRLFYVVAAARGRKLMPRSLSSVADPSASASPKGLSTTRLRCRRAAVPLGGGALAVIIIAVGAFVGWWFLPFAAGLVIGLAGRRRSLRSVLATAVAVAVTGWAIPLAWQAAHGEPVLATARAVAAVAGLPASAWLTLGVTLLVAAVQALTGGWLSRAVSGLVKA
jgi:hypothetical protein